MFTTTLNLHNVRNALGLEAVVNHEPVSKLPGSPCDACFGRKNQPSGQRPGQSWQECDECKLMGWQVALPQFFE